MPRQARLDAPGVLQHVIARGIERRKIFWDDKDRASFLERFGVILEETQTQCYAWALIPNHFHLLLRIGQTPLSTVMRRLMTGYAVTFNRRHRRAGHLFQNRYKSTICEEDPYLLELIRYIHLNPLRAGLVSNLKELDKYPWSGHSAILGRRKNTLIPKLEKEVSSADKRIGFSQFHLETEKARMNPENPACPVDPRGTTGTVPADGTGDNPACPVKSEGHLTGVKNKPLAEKTIEDVLLHFGDNLGEARRRYRQFVKKGIDQGKRPAFQGGGLVRSAGGERIGLLGLKKEERELSDDRILGSGHFVAEVLRAANEFEEKRIKKSIPIDQLADKITSYFGIKMDDILIKSQKSKISKARSIICYLAIKKMKYSGTSVGKFLNIRRYSALRCAERGKNILLCRETTFVDMIRRHFLDDADSLRNKR